MSWTANRTLFYRIFLETRVLECTDNITSLDQPHGKLWKRFVAIVNSNAVLHTFKNWFLQDAHNVSRDVCEQFSEWKIHMDMYPAMVITCIVLVCMTLLIPILVSRCLFLFIRSEPKLISHDTESMPNKYVDSEPQRQTNVMNKEISRVINRDISNDIKKDIGTTLSDYPRRTIDASNQVFCNVSSFLKHTSDYLFVELDKLLMDGRICSPSPLQSIIASPGARRRPTTTTGRLDSASVIAMADNEAPDEILARLEFQRHIVYGGRFISQETTHSSSKYKGELQSLMEFYEKRCVMRPSKVMAAHMIVNYSLLLLEKSLKSIDTQQGLRFLRILPTGSCKNGLKVWEPDQYDVHLVFQCVDFQIHRAIDNKDCGTIPVGKICLCSKHTNHILLTLNGENACVSCQSFLVIAGEFLDAALQRLYSKARGVIDRLPFRIQRAATPGLVVTLDTRSVLGLGLSEIRLRLIPSLPLLVPGWNPTNMCFAVPSWRYEDVKRKPSSRFSRYTCLTASISSTSPDTAWCMSYGHLEILYLQYIDMTFSMAGVLGCHRVLLKILKILFTTACKKSLLHKGEITSYILQTVVFFMLVESDPYQWTFEKLPLRFSDAVIFIKKSLQNKRLPNFFVSNPYFLKLFPHLQSLSFISSGRQENILADLSSDVIGKMVTLIDNKLTETKLDTHIQSEFSDDMWEYEYFLQI